MSKTCGRPGTGDGSERAQVEPQPTTTPGRTLLFFTITLILVGLVVAILLLFERADESRRVQTTLRRVEAHAQDISSLDEEAMARQVVAPALSAEFEHARREVENMTASLAAQYPHNERIAGFQQACFVYLRAAHHEMELAREGRFDEARQVDYQESDPSLSQLLKRIDEANQEYGETAERTVYRSKVGLVVAALLAVGVIVALFRQFERHHSRTERVLAEQHALRQSEERFRTLTEKSADIVAVTDREGVVTFISPSARSLLGLEEQLLIGKSHFDRIHPEDVARVEAALREVTIARESAPVEFRMRHADGTWLHFECILRNLLDDPNVQGLLINARHITERKKAEEQLAFNAGHDALTRLPNRTLFMDRIESMLERVRRHPDELAAVLFIDIDDFKVVNDCLGHDAGDALIVEVGRRLRACLRGGDAVARPWEDREGIPDAVARFGGDEFTILLEEIGDPSDAIRVAQRIQETISKPFLLGGQEVFKGASIGIAFASAAVSAETLLANADLAMYRAKSNGKSRCEIFDGRMHAQVTKRLETETALRWAIEREEFRLYYQPIVALSTGSITGFEALLRWERPGNGLVLPKDFVAVAEDAGLIVPIGKWVLLEACRQVARWNRGRESAPLHVSINVSARQFSYPGFVDQVKEALLASQADPQTVKLEITEGTAMEDVVRAEIVMSQLHDLGVQLSIDDFGTGYSSLSSLRRFPINTLKIDRSFVSTMHINPQSCAIVSTIVALARILGMDVVAEGLENREQLERLRSTVCDAAQGFLISQPIAADAIPAWLEAGSVDRLRGETPTAAAAGTP